MRQRTGEKDFTGETKKAVRRVGKPKEKGRGDALADLHRGAGNRAVRRLFSSGFVRGKLKVSEAGDRYEREADETAERIMRMPEGERLSSLPSPAGEGAPASVSPALEARIDALRGGGRPLPPKARAFFEPRFGRDFSDVRIHTGGEAGRLAGILRARAFTRGADIAFAPGEYRPDTFEGKRLLAHELTHVVQQQNNLMLSYIQRLVRARNVSCNKYPRYYPIFNVIGTKNPVVVLQGADRQALQMLNNTINELQLIRKQVKIGRPPAWPVISDAIALAMRRRLRLNPEDEKVWRREGIGTVEMIIRWYTNIRKLLANGVIHYTCIGRDCPINTWAYVYSNIKGRIYLCPQFWRDSQDNRALTIIHEAAHLYYDLSDRGRGVGNVHCLEEFVAEANGISIHQDFQNMCP